MSIKIITLDVYVVSLEYNSPKWSGIAVSFSFVN